MKARLDPNTESHNKPIQFDQQEISHHLHDRDEKRFASNTITRGQINTFDNEEDQYSISSPTKRILNSRQSDIGQDSKQMSDSQMRRNRRESRKGVKLEPIKSSEVVQVFKNHTATAHGTPPLEKKQQQIKVEVTPKVEATSIKLQKKQKIDKIFFVDEDEFADNDVIFDNSKPSVLPKRTPHQVILSDDEEDLQVNQNQQFNLQNANQQQFKDAGSQYINFSNDIQLKNQILRPLLQDSMIKMEINRDSSGFNTFWPQFHAYFASDNKYLLSGKKTSSKPTSTFIFSFNKSNFDEGSHFYLGKMKSNFVGDILNVYGPGLNPSNAKDKKQTPRQLLATIVYMASFFQAGKPREFMVYVKNPNVHYYHDFRQVRMYEDEVNLKDLYDFEENKSKISFYRNRQPVWKSEVSGYMLNFRGRVSRPSIKNFILEDPISPANDTLLFGKVSENKFNMDISYPLSPLVAFAISLSSFDSRIMCE